VPADFDPTSITFAGTDGAWVIGQAGTPGDCATAYCTSIAMTNDTGQTWQGVPAPVTGAPDGGSGVSGIRFLGMEYGWAFGPQLWQTTNGGQTWSPVATGGRRVIDLEAVGTRAFALFATCTGTGADFAGGCTSFKLEQTVAGSGTWTELGPELTYGGQPASAQLVLTGSQGYLLAPDGTIFSWPVGGSGSLQQVTRRVACLPGTGQASGQPSGALLAAGTPDDLAEVCNQSGKVFSSSDAGSQWTSGIALPGTGTASSISENDDGTVVVATTTGIEVLQGGSWQAATLNGGTTAPSGGFSYVGMTTTDQGVALPADTGLHEIWLTTDGGLSWAPLPVR
jgi:hypothetical protein